MKTTLLLSALLAAGGYYGVRAFRSGVPAGQREQTVQPSVPVTGETPEPAEKEAAPRLPRPEFDAVVAAEPLAQLPLLVQWLRDAEAGELKLMAEALDEKQRLSGGFWQALAWRWAEVAPDDALAFARLKSLEYVKDYRGFNKEIAYMIRLHIMDVYNVLLSLDVEAALQRLAQEPGAILNQLLRQLMSVEQPRREAWAAANAHLPEAALWAAVPAAAQPVLAKPYDRYGVSDEVTALRAMLIGKDLAGCRAKLDAMPMNYHRSLVEMDYAAALAEQKSPAEAVQWATANLKGLAKMQALALAAKVLSRTDPLAALKILRDNKVPDFGQSQIGITVEQSQMLPDTVKAAAKSDPQAAMDYLLTAGGILPRDMQLRYVDNDDTTNYGSLGRAIFKDWAAKDANAAAAWLAKQQSSTGLSEMVPLLAGPLLTQGAEQGRAFIQNLPQGSFRSEMVRYAAAQWAQTDTVTALQWAADQGGQAVLESTYGELAGKNATLASEHFASLPPEAQASQLPRVTEKLGEQKPQQLPQFIDTLTPEQQAAVDLRQPITSFAQQNIEQASAWVKALTPGPLRDSGISGLVDYLIQGKQPDPEAAAHWAAASSVPEDAFRRLGRVAEAWQKLNPKGTADAIRASTLPPAVQQELIGLLK